MLCGGGAFMFRGWLQRLQGLAKRRGLRWLVLLLAVVSSLQYFSVELPRDGAIALESPLQQAFEKRQSGVWVETEGKVVKRLQDDRHGARHQRFIIRLAGGQTLLVSHNIDLAPKVPLRQGDRVGLRGRYEWNEKGGLIHWTHHDPQGRRQGGWIEHAGKTYR
jgi:hypothetical protein